MKPTTAASMRTEEKRGRPSGTSRVTVCRLHRESTRPHRQRRARPPGSPPAAGEPSGRGWHPAPPGPRIRTVAFRRASSGGWRRWPAMTSTRPTATKSTTSARSMSPTITSLYDRSTGRKPTKPWPGPPQHPSASPGSTTRSTPARRSPLGGGGPRARRHARCRCERRRSSPWRPVLSASPTSPRHADTRSPQASPPRS